MAIEAIAPVSLDNIRARHQQVTLEEIIKGILSNIGEKRYYVLEIERRVRLQEYAKEQQISTDLMQLALDTTAVFERVTHLNEGINMFKSTLLRELEKEYQQGLEMSNKYHGSQQY